MKITISKMGKPAHLAILHLEGKLDRANYESLLDEAQELYGEGVRDLILDLSKLIYISSAGLSALHQVALLFRGEKRNTTNTGIGTRSADPEGRRMVQEHVKLFSPTRDVREALDLVGFDTLFEIFGDLPQAMGSFRQPIEMMGER